MGGDCSRSRIIGPPVEPTKGVVKSDRAIWVDRPWVDLLIGCGGWSVPLLLVSYTLVDRDVPWWSAAFYALALVCNYPHYMATIYRAYGRDDRGQYRLFTHYLTGLLVLVAIVAHARFALVPWLFTAYVMWSPWHYSGQNFGLLMMFLRRAGIDVSTDERRRLHVAFIASYVMLLAAFNQGASHDPLVLSIGLPMVVARIIEVGAGGVFLAAGVLAFAPLVRRAGARALLAPLMLYSTQALWFVVPIALTWVAALPVPQTRYSSGMLAVMHSAQYLWITRYFARRDAERGPAPVRWSAWTYSATLVAGGLALFLPVPWLASYGWHADFTASMFIVAAVVNIHHFMLDGVVWKLRNPRVGQVLVGAEGRTGEAASAATAPASTAPAQGFARRSWRLAVVVLLAALAALDQWRYLLAVGNTDRRRIEAATTLNPHDSGAYMRLAQAERQAGNAAAAEAALRRAIEASPQHPAPAQALERLLIEQNRFADAYTQCQAMIARWPADVDTLVNAGVLAYRLGDHPAAEQWWRQALDRSDALLSVHLYLAELLDARGETAGALPHYQRYLELVTRSAADVRPLPREVVPVVVKFADALARHGDKDAAVLQYDLAIRMARQTGLADVEALARQGRAAMGK
jgi:tetratricopeptide (TPR) repeat protein